MEGISAPAPYRIGERKEWVVSDEPATAGFAILVRTSITNAERAELRKRIDYIEGEYTDQWFAKPPEDRDIDSESPRALQRKTLAPYVYGWNAEAQTPEGEWQPVPPPAAAGYEAFDCILNEHMAWILDVILGGYYAVGKAVSLRQLSATIGSTSDAKPAAADPPPPAEPTRDRPKRRRSSSTRSESASTT